jgi:hypothetical protein
MSQNRARIPLRRGLAMRQLLITLGFALLVGLVTGGIELVHDWRALRGRIDASTRQNLELVRASAAEAAFQLNGGAGRQRGGGPAQFRGNLPRGAARQLRHRARRARPMSGLGGSPLILGRCTLIAGRESHEPAARLPGSAGRIPRPYTWATWKSRWTEMSSASASPGLAVSKMAFAVALAILLSLLLGVVFYLSIIRPLVGTSPAHRRTGPGGAGPAPAAGAAPAREQRVRRPDQEPERHAGGVPARPGAAGRGRGVLEQPQPAT